MIIINTTCLQKIQSPDMAEKLRQDRVNTKKTEGRVSEKFTNTKIVRRAYYKTDYNP